LIPDTKSAYDFRVLSSFANAFINKGFSVFVSRFPLDPQEILKETKLKNLDLIIQVNKFKPQVELPKRVIFITWIQDYFYENFKNKSKHNLVSDLVYSYTSLDNFGINQKIENFSGILLPGLSESAVMHDYRAIEPEKTYDFFIPAYIPKKSSIDYTYIDKFIHLTNSFISTLDLFPEVRRFTFSENEFSSLKEIVGRNYVALSGILNHDQLISDLLSYISNSHGEFLKSQKDVDSYCK
jgi:hypothetical protein